MSAVTTRLRNALKEIQEILSDVDLGVEVDEKRVAEAFGDKLPLQPMILDEHKRIRFRSNKLVDFLLDEASAGRQCDLNKLACINCPVEDREQFAQLIGYSLGGFGELSYVTDETYAEAATAARKKFPEVYK